MVSKRIIVGITGASGFAYGFKALTLLKSLDVETHLVISKSAFLTLQYEMPAVTKSQLLSLADKVYDNEQIDAPIASGSFATIGMLVAPCSMNTLSCIAHSLAPNLIARAADVVLKERRRLVLMTRETPLHLGHIKNMEAVTLMGGIIFPPVPALYNLHNTIDEVIVQSVARALSLFDLTVPNLIPWDKKALAEA